MVGYLNEHRQTLQKLGLNKVPSKSTIHRASARIPESYYRQMHFQVIAGIAAGNLAGDSSGFSIRRFIIWHGIKKDIEKLKKGRRKLHIIIEIRTRIILDYRITHAYRADAPVMADILNGMADSPYQNVGDACFDSAYMARGIRDIISKKMGRTPYIKPKRNTTAKSGGSNSWRRMVLKFLTDGDQFDAHYHQRSIVGSVLAALNERRGSLRSRTTHTQNGELAVALSKNCGVGRITRVGVVANRSNPIKWYYICCFLDRARRRHAGGGHKGAAKKAGPKPNAPWQGSEGAPKKRRDA